MCKVRRIIKLYAQGASKFSTSQVTEHYLASLALNKTRQIYNSLSKKTCQIS